MKIKKYYFSVAIGLLFLLLGYQNCGNSFESYQESLNSELNQELPSKSPEESDPEVIVEEKEGDKPVEEGNVPESLTKGLPLKVFPGAEGFGTDSIAGRGGRICIVENTNAQGNGSLRKCLESTGKRIVIFKTGGTIEVDKPIEITSPNVSVYGQTATGDGILLRSSHASKLSALNIRTNDVLIQHLRVRSGTSQVKGTACCRDSLSVIGANNVIFDHNSFSWGTDEIVEVWGANSNITFSYNIFSEGLFDNGSNDEGPAGRGFVVGSSGTQNVSIHHNFFAHNYQRNPLLKTSGTVDVVNNLVYHWVSRGGTQDSSYSGQKVNWVKNKFIAVTSNSDSKQNTSVNWGDINLVKKANSLKNSVYFEDNLGYHRPDNSMEQWKIAFTDYQKVYDPSLGYHVTTRFSAPKITEIPIANLESELPEIAGALLPKQDPVDARLVNELRDRNGIMPNCVGPNDRPGESRCNNSHVGGWPTMSPGATPKDTDLDGIPDEWELTYGLDPNKADSLEDRDGDGYLNIEEWVFSLNK